jgi:hypothetical protein
MHSLTRAEAIKLTDEVISSLTFDKAKEICEPVETALENVRQYAWNLGLGGWYYDFLTNSFCTDMVVHAVMLTYLKGLSDYWKEQNAETKAALIYTDDCTGLISKNAEDDLLTTAEAAYLLGTSDATVEKLALTQLLNAQYGAKKLRGKQVTRCYMRKELNKLMGLSYTSLLGLNGIQSYEVELCRWKKRFVNTTTKG